MSYDHPALWDLAAEIKEIREEHGFYTPSGIGNKEMWSVTEGDVMLGKLMLIVTEISEAAEAVRKVDYRNFAEELADATIRILDIAATTGIDLEAEIRTKMRINRDRPKGHGKKTNL